METKRIKDWPTWENKDSSRLPVPLKERLDRSPVFWVVREENAFFFVNAFREELDFVRAKSHGLNANCEELISNPSEASVEYSRVEPGEAVKIEEFDPILDSDWVLQVAITLKSNQHGHLEIQLPWKLGGLDSMVLLWDTGAEGRDVVVRKLD